MTYKIEIIPSAWEDLKCIEDWYLIQFDAETALRMIEGILDSIERLGESPEYGSLTPDKWFSEQRYRICICGKQFSIYRSSGDVVYIYHIVDTQMEYAKLFY